MISAYIHIPFCRSKCFYCSFVVAVAREHSASTYIECLGAEAKMYGGRKLTSLYFGGGTPSHLRYDEWEAVLGFISDVYSFEHDAEITIECNPESSMDPKKLKAWRRFGVNRISLGVQTFQDDYLNYLGRNHDKKLAVDSYNVIRDCGFENVSLDFIFGFEGQTLTGLEKDLREMLALCPDHISLYALDIEPRSRFYTRKVTVEPDTQARFYRRIYEVLTDQGYRQYEVSNYARSGYESRHNTHYWKGGDYIGLGVGAHGHINGHRYWNTPVLEKYTEQVKNGVKPVEGSEELDARQRFSDEFLFGLRMAEGVDLNALEKKYGHSLTAGQQSQVETFLEQGLFEGRDGRIAATLEGRLVLDEICARLI